LVLQRLLWIEQTQAMPYEHDLFISYRRRGDVKGWVQNHFYPRLKEGLTNQLPCEPTIWLDVEQEEGVDWPLNIRHALLRAKYLVAVWTPDYSRSRWCVAEWKSMLEREKHLGMRTKNNPRGLVYPIKYSDGQHFDPIAKATECKKDFSAQLNYPYPSWAGSTTYLAFHDRVNEVAADLANWLDEGKVPMWNEDWPVLTPAPLAAVRATRPEL
jgi:TIR domain